MKGRLPLEQHGVTGFELMLGYIGVLLILIGGIVLLSLLMLLWYPEEAYGARHFTLPGIESTLFGYLLFYSIRGRETGRLQRNQDATIVMTYWVLAVMICALPSLLGSSYTLTQAVSETTSAWSITGLSVVDVERTSHLLLTHRSTILFFGGIGLMLVMPSALSNTYGTRLYVAEGHNDHLLPDLSKSARIILTMYLCYIPSGVALYRLFGVSLFDALTHPIEALSTGGFSSCIQSIGYYDDIWIEMITIVLMLPGNINFLTYLFLVRDGLGNFFQYCEIRSSLLAIALAIPALGFLLCAGMGIALPHVLRAASLQVVSASATTGSQTVDMFVALPSTTLLLLIVLQLVGEGIGPTAGRVRQYCIYALCRSVWWSIESQLRYGNVIRPHEINRIGKKEAISPTELSQMGLYVVLYSCLFLPGGFTLCCRGHPIAYSMFEFSGAFGTVGPSAGIMTCDALSFILWIGTIGMLIGKLGIHVILLAAAKLGEDIRSRARRRKMT